MPMHSFALVLVLITTVLSVLPRVGVAQVEPQASCGSLHAPGQYGPYDYRTDRDKLQIVEVNHFTPRVEQLIGGISGTLGGELDYVLRAFPNHHRALNAFTRLSERSNWQTPQGAKWGVDCYFDRALRFRPDDTVARLLYASYLGKRKRVEEATAQLERATVDAGDNGFSHYNIGLLYFEIGAFEKALAQAHKAASLGFARPELAQRLNAAGKWRDPEPPNPEVAAPPSPKASQ
jgi:tetratricopeptide (TPR) repeat protein